jgi:phage gp36-like protein
MLVCSWSHVLARYEELSKLPNVGSASAVASETQTNLLNMAEAYIHGRLSSRYAVPFSANNLSAIDLIVDAVYVQNNMTRVPEKAKALKESLDERLNALLDGSSQMVTIAGTIAASQSEGGVWSDTMNYPPTFGVSDIEKSAVSSERLYAEDNARGEY